MSQLQPHHQQQLQQSSVSIDEKIMSDLHVVEDKMNLCDSMLRPASDKEKGDYPPTMPKYDALMGAIGFLEACAPRMIELVEAAAQGLLSEPVLMKCLEVNDRLMTMLSAIGKVTFTEVPVAAAATSPESDLLLSEDVGQPKDEFDDFEAFLNERTTGKSESS